MSIKFKLYYDYIFYSFESSIYIFTIIYMMYTTYLINIFESPNNL